MLSFHGGRSVGVFESVLDEILTGKAPAGSPLASERDLAKRFAVGRPAVRESLRRLEAYGLVQSRHGSGNRVLDWKRTGTIDLLPYYLAAGAPGTNPQRLLRELLNMRIYPTTEVVRLAAEYAPQADLDQADGLIDAAWTHRADAVAFALADLEVFRTLAAAVELPPAIWLLNSALPAYRLLVERFAVLVRPPADYRAQLHDVLGLCAIRKPAKAVDKLTSYFEKHDRAVLKRLGLKPGD